MIIRVNALRIAEEILRRAEFERITVADAEAARGIQFEDCSQDIVDFVDEEFWELIE